MLTILITVFFTLAFVNVAQEVCLTDSVIDYRFVLKHFFSGPFVIGKHFVCAFKKLQ